MKRFKSLFQSGVAASLCRGAFARLLTPARRHSAVATTLHIRAMAFGLFPVFAIAIQSLCRADVTKLAWEDRKILEHPSQFHEVHSTSDLPSAVVTVCAGAKGNMANPGEKWNATDVIIDPALPGKRLIWAAVGNDYYVVHYERGGIAHSYHIIVAKLPKDNARPQVIWSAIGGPFRDYPAFLGALRNGKLDDRLDYAR